MDQGDFPLYNNFERSGHNSLIPIIRNPAAAKSFKRSLGRKLANEPPADDPNKLDSTKAPAEPINTA